MRKLIIIPTFNERDNIDPLLEGIFAVDADVEVLFVDDNSPDGTGHHLDALAAKQSRIHVLHRTAKEGLGRAYLAGFAWSRAREYDLVTTMDADLSHPSTALPSMWRAAEQADVVVGSRYVGGIRVINWPLYRLILSKGAATYARLLTGLPVRDPTSGFMVFRRAVLDSFPLDDLEASGYSFLIELKFTAWRMGFVIGEQPITFIERVKGDSKMSSAIIVEAMRIVLKLVLRKGGGRRPPATQHPQSVVCRGNEDGR